MRILINNKIAYGIMWGLLAHVPLLSYGANQGDPPYLPEIVKEPEDKLVMLGENASFTVVAHPKGGKEELAYQWLFNCDLIPDGTNSFLTINNVTTNNVGFYSCAVHGES